MYRVGMKRLAVVLAVVGCAHPSPPSPTPTLPAAAPAPTPAPAPPPAPAAPPERWATSIVLGANFLDFVVMFPSPDGHDARVEVGDKHLPLSQVTHTDARLEFTVEKAGPKETWEHYALARTGDVARGEADLGTHHMSVRMERLGPDEPPRSAFKRPQTPRPPFPYAQRDLVVAAPDGGKLAGTLAIPTGTGPFPTVLLLSGSGQQDRDETVFGHKPYLIVADRLARAGIASYRFDDRGTGQTVGAPLSLDTEIADAIAALDTLAKQPEVDPKRLGIIAHSAAGAVAPNAARKHAVAFVVLLAGTTLDGGEYAAVQTEETMRAAGADAAAIAEQQKAQRAVSTAAKKGAAEVEKALVKIATPALAKALGRAPTADEVKQAIAQPLAAATNPWTLSYFRIDPRDAWKTLNVPVLLMVGDKDTQVPADLTIGALTKTLGKRGPLTAKKLPGLNHLFQHAPTGALSEYVELEESFAPEALDTLAAWLAERTKK